MPRIQAARRLSYSSLMALHKCPRFFVLQRIKPEPEASIHLAYGSSFGVGLQALMIGKSLEQAVWEAFLAWPVEVDLLEEKEKDKKSFWFVIAMLEKFASVKDQLFTEKGWEVAVFNGRPAVELGARINFPDGFYYLIFVDLVLVNKARKELKVFELKTTKYDNPNPALFGNSWQALFYSVFLDAIVSGYVEEGIEFSSSYEVLYFLAKSAKLDFEFMPFKKSSLQKARSINWIIQDIARIQSYEEEGSEFPMYGESCFNFASFRECPYFGACHMELPNLVLKSWEELATWDGGRNPEKDAEKIHFTLDAMELIQGQLGQEFVG